MEKVQMFFILVQRVVVTKCSISVGGLRLPKVLKNTTNMFSKYNICTGTFGHGMKTHII
jgi:benzoyl-CoA reductase/2-hydroxyglutaryl-CoA dehydratase subunit BcrC/BadD/HgdB